MKYLKEENLETFREILYRKKKCRLIDHEIYDEEVRKRFLLYVKSSMIIKTRAGLNLKRNAF